MNDKEHEPMSAMLADARPDEATAVVETPRPERKRVVIVGGGFAGLDGRARAAARRCRGRADRPAQSPYISAAALPGGDGGPLSRRDRCADPSARGEAAKRHSPS